LTLRNGPTTRRQDMQPSKHCALYVRLTTEQNDDGSNVCYVTVPLFAGSMMNDKCDCNITFSPVVQTCLSRRSIVINLLGGNPERYTGRML